MWIPGSRQFKDFEDYLLPPERFAMLRDTPALPLAIDADGESYVSARLALLEHKLREVDRLAGDGELPDAEISGELLKVTPLRKSVPREAELLEDDAFACLPHVKITDLLLEVDRWTHFTRHFTHQRHGAPTKDRAALLTVVLADAINLGLSKMSEACPGTTFYKLDTLRAWHIRDETYSMALAELVNYQHRLPFAAIGAAEPPPPPTASDSRSAGAGNIPVLSICAMALIPESRSTRTSPTSTRRFTRRSSTRRSAMPRSYSTDCSITKATCGSRSTTRTRSASPTMCSFCAMPWDFDLLRVFVISPTDAYTCPARPVIIPISPCSLLSRSACSTSALSGLRCIGSWPPLDTAP